MPYHNWGDEDFDWNSLNTAINFIMDFWRRYGRIGSHGKEKFGTFRDHPYFYTGWWAIHQLVKPGYVRYTWPSWMYKVDLFLGRVVHRLRLQRLVFKYQAFVYNIAIQIACKRYPHIVDELVADLEGYELVKPGLFGKIDGTIIHKKYWRTV